MPSMIKTLLLLACFVCASEAFGGAAKAGPKKVAKKAVAKKVPWPAALASPHPHLTAPTSTAHKVD
jgi:hypothetical protein